MMRKVKSMMSKGTSTSFGSLKQIDAGVLNVGYAEAGPTAGPAVILLHGWPYGILRGKLRAGQPRIRMPFGSYHGASWTCAG